MFVLIISVVITVPNLNIVFYTLVSFEILGYLAFHNMLTSGRKTSKLHFEVFVLLHHLHLFVSVVFLAGFYCFFCFMER